MQNRLYNEACYFMVLQNKIRKMENYMMLDNNFGSDQYKSMLKNSNDKA